jgi:hypothetical protein
MSSIALTIGRVTLLCMTVGVRSQPVLSGPGARFNSSLYLRLSLPCQPTKVRRDGLQLAIRSLLPYAPPLVLASGLERVLLGPSHPFLFHLDPFFPTDGKIVLIQRRLIRPFRDLVGIAISREVKGDVRGHLTGEVVQFLGREWKEGGQGEGWKMVRDRERSVWVWVRRGIRGFQVLRSTW